MLIDPSQLSIFINSLYNKSHDYITSIDKSDAGKTTNLYWNKMDLSNVIWLIFPSQWKLFTRIKWSSHVCNVITYIFFILLQLHGFRLFSTIRSKRQCHCMQYSFHAITSIDKCNTGKTANLCWNKMILFNVIWLFFHSNLKLPRRIKRSVYVCNVVRNEVCNVLILRFSVVLRHQTLGSLHAVVVSL